MVQGNLILYDALPQRQGFLRDIKFLINRINGAKRDGKMEENAQARPREPLEIFRRCFRRQRFSGRDVRFTRLERDETTDHPFVSLGKHALRPPFSPSLTPVVSLFFFSLKKKKKKKKKEKEDYSYLAAFVGSRLNFFSVADSYLMRGLRGVMSAT